MLPLEGITVVAVEQAVAAPFCSSRLADAGAQVIKVERPEGDFARGYDAAAQGQSSYFVWLNRGKDSVVIDLATQEGRAELENLIGEEGKGFRYILSGMNAERILIAAECIGDAKWFVAKASAYAKERAVFGRPIGQNQGVQFPIAKAYAAMRAAELMVREATRKYEAGLDCGAEANMVKMLAADASWEAANACVQTHGGFGFAEEYDVERKFRETRLYQVAPISTNLILSYLAEHVLGMPRSY